MKNKIVCLLLVGALCTASFVACGQAETTEVAASINYANETVSGEVTAVSDNGFTLDVNGETIEVTVNDDTNYSIAMGEGQGEGPSGEAPSGDAPSGDAPSGDAPSGDKPEGGAPDGDGNGPSQDASSQDAPSGEAPSGDKPEGGAPDGEGNGPEGAGQMELSLESIQEGAQVTVTFDADGNVTDVEISMSGMAGGPGGMGGMTSAEDITYSALNEYDSDATVDGETVESTGDDENAYLISGGEVTISNTSITKNSANSTGGDNSSFYGVGATILTKGGTSYIDNVTIDSNADGGAGVFAYSDGVSYVANSTITTTGNTSGGIHAAGGGTLYAWDNTVETSGESSAAIRSDRGGGTMVVDGGSYTSNGTGSPAVYCTADIAINDADLTANGAEAVCIEGFNTLRLFDCDLTGDMPESDQNDCDWNIILYQSMSGDSEVGNSTYEMVGGSLTAKNGGMFYTTNTESTFILNDVDITYADDNDFFLKVTGNDNARGWGSSGANGAECTFTGIDQEMEGDILWDSISTLDFYMTDGSTLTGAVLDDESAAGNGGDGYCNMYISSDSTWVVTADSTVTNLYAAGSIVDESGNSVSIVGTDGTVYVEGTSSITITVGSYSDNADMSGASSVDSFDAYAVAKPSQLS